MNVADVVGAVKKKKEFDFFNKVAYICDNLGKNINANESKEIRAYHYNFSGEENDLRKFFLHTLPENKVLVKDESINSLYYLNKKDYSSCFFNPVIPERWEKLVDDILKSE